MTTQMSQTEQLIKEDAAVRSWHLDKRVNVTHLIATFTMAAGMFTWAATIDRRLALNEVAITTLNAHNARQDSQIDRNTQAVKEEFRDLRSEIKDQGKKMDRLLELVGGRK